MAAHDHHHHQEAPVVVVVVPFLAQSHLNQLLHLSRLISSYRIPVHYVSTATHSRQVRLRYYSTHAASSPETLTGVRFHEFPTPPFASPPPNPNSSSKFPAHKQPCYYASLQLRRPFAALAQELSSSARRLVVIHDPLMGFVIQDAASIPNAEIYTFHCISAIFYLCFVCRRLGKPSPVELDPAARIPIPSGETCFPAETMKFVSIQSEFKALKDGDIFNTCRAVEGSYLDLVAKEENSKNQWAIAPLNPVRISRDDEYSSSSPNKCLVWLEKQPPKSVIYVSFGSTTSLSDEEIKALAIGLEDSKQKFLWVLRDADRGDIFVGEDQRNGVLPQGFEDRMKDEGMVIRDWAPQLEILAHPSIGGFMSHCGWNSIMESLTMGVPIAAWPMHSDQPYNAQLITEVLKVGLLVREWGHEDEPVTGSAIKRVVEGLMASKEGDQLRKRAEELGIVLRQSMEAGGVSRMEIDNFIAHITR